jgi:hypothetical protein
MRTLSRLPTDAGLSKLDVVSLDIEGCEDAALGAFAFDRHRVGVWGIETNADTPPWALSCARRVTTSRSSAGPTNCGDTATFPRDLIR